MQKIDVLLLQDVKTLGKKYDVVAVKPVYARNILFPQGMARFADKWSLNDLRAKMTAHQKSQQTLVEKLKSMINTLKETNITLDAEANDTGKLYGKVHAKDIASKLTTDFGVEVDSDYLSMEDISTTGTHTIKFNGEWVIWSFECVVTSK